MIPQSWQYNTKTRMVRWTVQLMPPLSGYEWVDIPLEDFLEKGTAFAEGILEGIAQLRAGECSDEQVLSGSWVAKWEKKFGEPPKATVDDKDVAVGMLLSRPANVSMEVARDGWYKKLTQQLMGRVLDPTAPFLSITMPCGFGGSYRRFEDIPDHDVPCGCGNPKHWLVKYEILTDLPGPAVKE